MLLERDEVREEFDLPAPITRGDAPADAARMTYKEYWDHLNPSGKYHDDGAYQMSVEKMNSFGTGPEGYPKLIRNLRVNGLDFQVRLGWDYERTDGGDPQYKLAVFNRDRERVALMDDEWGAVLIAVADEYQGFGFGTILGKITRTLYPNKSSGGFTASGSGNIFRVYQGFVRDALTQGKYREWVRSGEMTNARAREIIASAKLKTPKKREEINLNTNDPSDWLLLAEYGGFTLYDQKLPLFLEHKPDWAERCIKGNALVRIIEHREEVAVIVRFGGDSPAVKRFLLVLCAAFAQSEGTILYVDESDREFIDEQKLEILPFRGDPKVERIRTGMPRIPVRLKKRFSYDAMAIDEARWRKSRDPYGELKGTILELAYGKY